MPLDVCPICRKQNHSTAKKVLKCFEAYVKLKNYED